MTANSDSFPRISICILSYNRKHKLAINLRKIQHNLAYPADRIEVFVVENASSDGSADMVREEFPWVKLLSLKENTGVTGWNSAFAEASGKYVVVLDDDAFLDVDALLNAVARAEADDRLGILAFRIVSPTNGMEFTKEYPTGVLSYWGCGALLRKSMLDEIGFYDPQFFFQAFELDLSIRARARGWTVGYANDAIAYHMTSIATSQSPQKFYFSRRNLIIVASKSFRLRNRLLIIARLIQITFAYGSDQSLKNKLRAIVHGLSMGWRSKKNLLPYDLEKVYRDNFCEFISANRQKRIWQDVDRTFWRKRNQHYPDIFNSPDLTGNLLISDAVKDGDRYEGEGWLAISGEKNWFGTHPPIRAELAPLKLTFRDQSVAGQRLQGMVSLPDDRAAPVKAIVDVIRKGQVIARFEILDLHDHIVFDLPLPDVVGPVDIVFYSEMAAADSSPHYCTVYWLGVKITAVPYKDPPDIALKAQDGFPCYSIRNHRGTAGREELTDIPPRGRLLAGQILRVGDQKENVEQLVDDLHSIEEISPHVGRAGSIFLDPSTARASKFYYDDADWRAIITRPSWALTHPIIGQTPASLQFQAVALDGHVFKASMFVPLATQPVVFVLRVTRQGFLIREVRWTVHPGVMHETAGDIADLSGMLDLSISCEMPHGARDAASCSSYWIMPRLEKAQLAPARKMPNLTIIAHSLNVDGANAVILDVLRRPSFASRFGEIRFIAPRRGRLVETLRELGVHISVIPLEGEASQRRAHILERHLLDADHVWVNTIDHPHEVYRALIKAGSKGMIFGHESMGDDSLVLPTTRWNAGTEILVKEVRALGNMRLFWPSTSTVQQAQNFLALQEIGLLPYGINSVEIKRDPYEESGLDTVRFFVGGWYCRRKNQDAIVTIFEEVERLTKQAGNLSRYRDYHITFCGTLFANYDYLDFMKEATSRLPASKLTFKSMVSNGEMRQLLADSHFLAVNALSEALPVTMMETMSNGGLVISSDVEGSEDLIRPDNGFLHARQDFAAAIKLYLSLLDPEQVSGDQLQRMSSEAEEHMRNFSMGIYEDNVIRALGVKSASDSSLFELARPEAPVTVYKGQDWTCVATLPGDRLLTHPPRPGDGNKPAEVSFRNIYWFPGAIFNCRVEARQAGRMEDIYVFVTLTVEGSAPVQERYILSLEDPAVDVSISIPSRFFEHMGAISLSSSMHDRADDNAFCSVIWSNLHLGVE